LSVLVIILAPKRKSDTNMNMIAADKKYARGENSSVIRSD